MGETFVSKELLSIPESWKVVALTTFAYPDEKLKQRIKTKKTNKYFITFPLNYKLCLVSGDKLNIIINN